MDTQHDLVERLHPHRYRDVAQMVLPTPTFAWVDAGTAGSEDIASFQAQRLIPRVTTDVSAVRTAVTVAGAELRIPLLSGPMGLQRALHPDGEAELARGVAAAGAGMVLAATTTVPVEEVRAAASGGVQWFQLPSWADRGALGDLADRAAAAGVRALVPLVNAPVGAVHLSAQAGFRLPDGVALAHPAADPTYEAGDRLGQVAWLAERTGLPIIPKGVMHPDDARAFVSAGAAGVIVSNHGARQLPRAVGVLDALPPIADTIGGDAEVYLDGGVRSGTDVLVALAAGARAVLVGRPLAFALAVGGARAVERAIGALHAELIEAAALCGVADLSAVPRDVLAERRTR